MALISSRQLATLFNLGHQSLGVRARRVRAMDVALSFTALLLLLLAARSAGGQALSPGGPVDFGSTPLGNTSTNITLTFTANTTTTVSAITALTDGALNQDFSVVGQSCLGTLSPPASCLITLNFKPSQIGLRRGELLITDGTGAYANRVPLHGVGLGPQVVFSPAVSSAITTLPNLAPTTFSPSAAVYDGAGNLFVLDTANNRLLEQTPSQTITGDFSIAATIPSLSAFSSLAISGEGTLFISSPNTATVYSLIPGGSPTVLPVGVALQRPAGLATDGYGYLYIADNGTNRLLRVALDGSGTAAFSLAGLPGALSGPVGLAIDINRNLYVADRGNNRIVRVSLNTGAASLVPISGSTLLSPAGLVVDSAGSLTVADTGHNRLVVAQTSGSAFVLPITGPALATPASVLLQPNGDLLVSDTSAGLVSLSRSAMSVAFPTSTKVGSTDIADGELSFVIQNTGSYALNLGGQTAPTLSTAAFSVAGDSTCPVVPATSTSVTPFGQSSVCTYRVNFKPIKQGVNNATLTMAFTAIGGTGTSSSVSPFASLTGNGYAVLTSFSLSINPANTTLGAPVSVTVTALRNDGSIADDYTGTATFTSTDPRATFLGGPALPGPATYTFTTADAGVHTFAAVAGQGWAFNSVGSFTITASDSLDNTITGTSNPVSVINTSAVTLTSATNPTLAGDTTVLTASVSASAGSPTGTVTFLDGTTVLGTTNVSGGKASLTISFSTAGVHTLTASYSGDSGFLPATSAPLAQTVEDFSLAVASGGSTTATIVNKGSASFSLVVAPLGGSTLAGPVALALSGLPAGYTGTFTPATIPAGAGSTGVGLVINGGRMAALQPHAFPWTRGVAPLTLAFAALPFCFSRRRLPPALRMLLLLALSAGACTGFTGCLSDTTAGYYGTIPSTQTFTVTATSGQLSHSLTLSLTLK